MRLCYYLAQQSMFFVFLEHKKMKGLKMKIWKKVIVIACMLAMMVPAFGCSEEGSMEKAGKKMDQMADDAKDAAKKAFE